MCKRRPQGRDLLHAPYGRFFHLPQSLAQRGHEVTVALLSYAGLPSEAREAAGVRWVADDARAGFAYLRRVRRLVDEARPDWIGGLSDTWFGILAARFAGTSGSRCWIDAYDNFESYMPWALPLHAAWRRALRRADLVTAPGSELGTLLARTSGRDSVAVLPMAADPAFRPMDRAACRARLGLDPAARYVGVAGSLDARRGRDVVLDALELLRSRRPEAVMLLSGRNAAALHGRAGIRSVGLLADDDVPAFVNSLDVACVPAADNAFGRYSYPAKLCEAMACEVPVVASATAPVKDMLGGDARFLAPVGDAQALAGRIEAALPLGRVRYGALATWADGAAKLESWLAGFSSSQM